MAGRKRMENAVAVNEVKEVGFADLELSIKKPTLGKGCMSKSPSESYTLSVTFLFGAFDF